MHPCRLHPFALEPLAADFPYARTLIVLRSERTIKKSGARNTESRYYLSSAPPEDYTPGQWLDLIRGHWGAVEIRNHWRRDALLGQDGSRSRHPTLLANVALLRNALLAVLVEALEQQSLPQLRERLHSHPARGLALLAHS